MNLTYILPKYIKTCHKDIYCNTTYIVKDWKLSKCPIIEDQLNKLLMGVGWGIYHTGRKKNKEYLYMLHDGISRM